MKWVFFGVLGVILLVILRKFVIRRRAAAGGSGWAGGDSGSRTGAAIAAAKVGDDVEMEGVGERFEHVHFTIDRRSRYEAGGATWYEVSGTQRGERVYVELYEDDDLEVTVQLPAAALSLDDLGLTEKDLARMDDERNPKNTVAYNGETWSYASSEEISYSKDGKSPLEGYYSWEFESADGHRVLFVEKWEGEPFEAGIVHRVHAEDIRVSPR